MSPIYEALLQHVLLEIMANSLMLMTVSSDEFSFPERAGAMTR
jgi:hypothetical protein